MVPILGENPSISLKSIYSLEVWQKKIRFRCEFWLPQDLATKISSQVIQIFGYIKKGTNSFFPSVLSIYHAKGNNFRQAEIGLLFIEEKFKTF